MALHLQAFFLLTYRQMLFLFLRRNDAQKLVLTTHNKDRGLFLEIQASISAKTRRLKVFFSPFFFFTVNVHLLF